MKKKDNIFREEILGLRPYVQGKPIEDVQREYGLQKIEKLASNENHFGTSKKVLAAAAEELKNVYLYPDGSGRDLKKKIAETHGVGAENIVLGTGGEQLIFLLSLAMLGKGDNIVTFDPSFDPYEMGATLMGAETRKVRYKGDRPDIDEMIKKTDGKTKIVWAATPNNPTGSILREDEMRALAEGLPEKTLLVLDEAYYEFATAFRDYPKGAARKLKLRKNIVLIRTFSKIYALAGLRVGYLFAREEIAEKLNAINLTFGVNRVAEKAALTALSEKEYLEKIIKLNKEALAELTRFFDEEKINYVEPRGNFIWADADVSSKELFEALQKEGVIIRPGYHWGYDNFIRVSTGTERQLKTFEDSFRKAVRELKK